MVESTMVGEEEGCRECSDGHGVYDFEAESVGEDGDEEQVQKELEVAGQIDEESGVRPRRHRSLGPSSEERRAHEVNHLPFRSWCSTCMAGRGVAAQHRHRRAAEDINVPSVSFDYCFLRNEAQGACCVVLVGRDRQSGALLAHAAPAKGSSTEWAVQQVVKDLKKFGHYGKVILKSDQEPAITTFLEEVAKAREGAQTILEHSPVGDSQSNGLAERAVRSLEEMTRVYKLDLEGRVGQRIQPDDPIFEWLVEYAADMVTKCQVGHDGQTAYKRLKGKTYNAELLKFGAVVNFKLQAKVQGGIMTERWMPGVWLGQRFSTQEHLIGRLCDGKVVRCRTVKEIPRDPTMEDLRKIIGRPWSPGGLADNREVPDVPRAAADPSIRSEKAPPSFQPRSVYITSELLVKYGYTESCRKCRLMSRNLDSQTAGHSKECRARIESALKDDPVERRRLEAAEERKSRYLEAEVQRCDEMMARREIHSAPRGNKRRADVDPASLREGEKSSELDVPVAGPVADSAAASGQGSSARSSASGGACSSREALEADAQIGDKRKADAPEIAPQASTSMDVDQAEEPPATRRRLSQLLGVLRALHDTDYPLSEGGIGDQVVLRMMGEEWLDDLDDHTSSGLPGVPARLIEAAKREELQKLTKMQVYAEVSEDAMRACPDAVEVGS